MACSTPSDVAHRCVSVLKSGFFSISNVLWLAAGDTVLKASHIGRSLLSLIQPDDPDVARDASFVDVIMHHEADVIRTVNKELYAVEREKIRALALFHKLLCKRDVPQPVMPFMFQTANGRDFSQSRFYVFNNWQDRLFEMLKIDFHGGINVNGALTPVTQIYELQAGDVEKRGDEYFYRENERICYLIFDWELLESQFNDACGKQRLSSSQIAKVAMTFPRYVYEQMLARSYIRAEDVLRVVVKRKSRAVSGDFKHSYHFIFKIAGTPVVHHKAFCNEMMRPFAGDKQRMKKDKSLAFLSDAQLSCPIWGVDPINHGNQPFASLLSRKTRKDPYPQLRREIFFQCGAVQRVEQFPEWPTDQEDVQVKLRLLHAASFTVPSRGTISYTDSLTLQSIEAPQIRTVVKAPSAASRGGKTPPFDDETKGRQRHHLPNWVESVLVANGGYKKNGTMGCLGKQKERLARVRQWVDMKILHVTKMFCPMRLCLLPPVLHVHENNGTMIAWEGSEEEATEVYVRCTYCNMHHVHKEVEGCEEDGHNRAMPIVGGWLVLTKDLLSSLIEKGTGLDVISPTNYVHSLPPFHPHGAFPLLISVVLSSICLLNNVESTTLYTMLTRSFSILHHMAFSGSISHNTYGLNYSLCRFLCFSCVSMSEAVNSVSVTLKQAMNTTTMRNASKMAKVWKRWDHLRCAFCAPVK